jgi:hypothetical protein
LNPLLNFKDPIETRLEMLTDPADPLPDMCMLTASLVFLSSLQSLEAGRAADGALTDMSPNTVLINWYKYTVV